MSDGDPQHAILETPWRYGIEAVTLDAVPRGGASHASIPRRGRTELETVWAIDTELRDVHMTRVLVEQVRAGKRVFAVIGRSHVVNQEPALRALLPSATITTEFLEGEWGEW